MPFHRLGVPSYFGGLPGGYDYINNAISGTPANADGAKSGGPNAGTYFVAFGEDATSSDFNRANKALSQNTDFIDDLLHQDLAVPTRTNNVTPGGPVASITIIGPGIFLGNISDELQDLFHITDGNDNDIEVTGTKVAAASISSGGSLGSGFSAGNVTIALTVAIPSSQTYRVWYGTRSNLANLPSDAFVSMRVRSAVQVDAVTEELFRLLHGNGEAWNAAWDSDIYTLNQGILELRTLLANLHGNSEAYNATWDNTIYGLTFPLATLAALKAINTTGFADGTSQIVKYYGRYVFHAAATDTEDQPAIVTPTTGSGRWYADDVTTYGKTITSTAGTTWVCPANVHTVLVTGWGGGGGGGGGGTATTGSSETCGGGGGGSGQFLCQIVPVTPGHTYTLTAGDGGTGGGANSNGNPGNPSSFFDNGTAATPYNANGGGPGSAGVDVTSVAAATAPGGTYAGEGRVPGIPAALVNGGGAWVGVPWLVKSGDGGVGMNKVFANTWPNEGKGGPTSWAGGVGGASGSLGGAHEGGGGGGGGGGGYFDSAFGATGGAGGNGSSGGVGSNGSPGVTVPVANSGAGGAGGGGGGSGATGQGTGGAGSKGAAGYLTFFALN